jgi:pimeloyl-ACP methyl ester carboxylesterase
MDYESQESRDLGCWDAPSDLSDLIDFLTTNHTVSTFELPQKYADFLIDIGFGKSVSDKDRDFWRKEIAHHYSGDDGRRRARMAAINLRDRDGLHGRLFDVRCPVLWLHGTSDPVYSVKNAQREIKKFVNSPDAQLRVVEGGEHFLSFSHPKDVDAALVEFVGKYSKV